MFLFSLFVGALALLVAVFNLFIRRRETKKIINYAMLFLGLALISGNIKHFVGINLEMYLTALQIIFSVLSVILFIVCLIVYLIQKKGI